ncbi:MAG: choline dehydrogenase [Rhodobacter sp.]|uniref:choline dehydrogenase n=1 Tax=Pararhodobacter sp. TaxID=2127056 RepID=UPI001DE474B5|nr:choline dehydrogenase [Pararhodobacter sp.]MCB1344093.1 choline dehydrogenase [Paracoccaceae bacterium]MCC0071655.1 choline dehydrogenase [Rhodobacter sp.]HPD93460.1 choline dehydrogenase [Pararhodobacter sp.]
MQAEYVIVGAGSGGSAVAWRLAEAGHSVAVIEFGGSDAGPFIQMPGALSYPMNMARYDWGLASEPEPGLNNRRMATPRGKVLGGSSSVNGMVYVRGHARDYDHWAEQGADGWAFADVLPYFKRMEHWHGAEDAGGGREWRGHDGPLHVSRGARANPLFDAFIEAGRQAGYRVTRDYNGCQQEGFGAMEATIWRGERWSAAKAYLRPAMRTGRVRVIRGLAARVVMDGTRATGVALADGRVVTAAREVILAASSINTPKLLMLSGIGPAEHLRAQGIAVVADRAGVGGNLQDHLELYLQFATREPISLFKYWNAWGKAWVGAQWLLFGKGPGASNQFESCGFIRSRAGIDYPDIQYHFLPIAVRYDGKAVADGHGFQAHVGPMRSKSRGTVRLRSSDPAEAPEIRFNYMSHPDDWTEFRTAIRLTREIMAQPAMAQHVKHEIQPGAAIQDDAALDDFIRAHAESAYHPCGTARMGRVDDPLAVVDPQGRVIGVQGLRVADSSVFPRITNGNLNAPSILTGEKMADHILGREPLPASNLEPWIHPDWRVAQR